MGSCPIISSCNSPTENISQFIDYWLQPHTRQLPSFLKDTTQFIQEIKTLQIPPGFLLVTIDVKSLYTNIPHDEDIKACKEAFIELEKTNTQQPLLKSLQICWKLFSKNNIFEFNGQCCKQLYGTVMGTKLAPAYANTFMGHIENNFLKTQPHLPIYYRRFIDDIFIVWPHLLSELNTFMTDMNQIHPSMQFTFEFDAKKSHS